MQQSASYASVAEEVHEQVENLRVQNGGCLEILARSRRPGENKNAGTDDGADAKRHQRPGTESLLQTVVGIF
jgi:hypothetical protein